MVNSQKMLEEVYLNLQQRFFRPLSTLDWRLKPISLIQFGFRGTLILLEGKALNLLSLGRHQMLKLGIPRLIPFSFGRPGHIHL